VRNVPLEANRPDSSLRGGHLFDRQLYHRRNRTGSRAKTRRNWQLTVAPTRISSAYQPESIAKEPDR